MNLGLFLSRFSVTKSSTSLCFPIKSSRLSSFRFCYSVPTNSWLEKWQEEEVSLEWLSLFVEDCLTSTGNNLPLTTTKEALKGTEEPLGQKQIDVHIQSSAAPALEKFVVPSKARSKRKRVATIPKSQTDPLTIWSKNLNPNGQNLNLGTSGYSDPPLLSQGTWLADSELIIPKGEEKSRNLGVKREAKDEEGLKSKEGTEQQGQGRRCSHCQTQRTPQWRAGPLGPKTLCNACGVRYKSGRLLPEYRPAKSPSFVTHLHSNSHKKVLEMRKGGCLFS